MENKELTLQGIKDIVAFTDERKQILDSIIDIWYCMAINEGMSEQCAISITLDKLAKKLDQYSMRIQK